MIILVIFIIFMVLVAVQNAVYKKFWARNLTMEMRFSRKHAYEGERVELIETVTNRKLLPLHWLAVKFAVSPNLVFSDMTNTAVSDQLYRNDLFTAMPYQRITRTLGCACKKRGFYKIRGNLTSANLLMDRRFALDVGIGAEITVFPKIIDVSLLDFAGKRLMGDAFTRRFINPDPFQFKGIREYMPTDEFKNINFKASAKTGTLMVSEKDYTVEQEIIIALNLESATAWQDVSVAEESIRLAASFAAKYIDEGMPVGLICCGEFIRPAASAAHLFSILDFLARLELSAVTRGFTVDAEEDKVYVFISAYYGQDFQKMFQRVTESTSALWILPANRDDSVKVDEEIAFERWDVAK